MPSSIRQIKRYAFEECENIEELYIADGVEELPMSMCFGCRKLKKIFIPSSVKVIDKTAVSACDDVIIYTSKNSAAEKYAIEKGIQYALKNENGEYEISEPIDSHELEKYRKMRKQWPCQYEDEQLGEVRWSASSWDLLVVVELYGKKYELRAELKDWRKNGISQAQKDEFSLFFDPQNGIQKKIEDAIWEFYQNTILGDQKDFLDEDFLEFIPEIQEKNDLVNHIALRGIVFEEESDEVNLVFDTRWYYDEGMGIRIIGDKIVVIGGSSEVC